jgi:type I restriction enzyme S subunit
MKQYSSYKDSGIEWIGEIPKEWTIQRLKHISNVITGTTPSTSKNKFYENGTVLWVKPDNLNQFIEIFETKQKLTSLGVDESRLIPPNSVLMCGVGSIGKFGYSSQSVCTNQQINSIVFNKNYSSRLGLYLVSFLKQEFIKNSEKVVVSILNKTKQENITVIVPPLQEQKQIADYLDKETDRIDLLLEKTEKKIELLKEQRNSIISQAVTKGLDPNVEMKDSGVEWIGEIPKGWQIRPLYSCFNENTKINDNSTDVVLSLSYGKLITRNIDTNFGLLPEKFDTYQILTKGNILLRMLDLQNDKISLRVGFCRFKGIISSAYIGLESISKVYEKYYYYYLHSCDIKKVFYSLGGGVRQSVSFKDFKRFPIIISPIQEQKQIADYLDKETDRIDSIVELERKRMELLEEYRQSLISNAVTGKMDVRGMN